MLLKTSYIKISFFFSSFLLRVAIKKATVTCSWRFICSDILKLDARDAYLRFMRNKLTGHFLLSTASTKAQENKTTKHHLVFDRTLELFIVWTHYFGANAVHFLGHQIQRYVLSVHVYSQWQMNGKLSIQTGGCYSKYSQHEGNSSTLCMLSRK